MLFYIGVLFQFILVQSLQHQKPVAEKIWSVRCKKNDHVLNDCNWCWCGPNYHFQCKARVCEEVDVFGHFKDTIQELDVGMEGHGTWRSRLTSCTPGVQYRRGTLHCVCDDDGNWPNPVCRDLFRILHSVEITESVEESTSQNCSPTKLHLIGCNACFCPSSGKLDAKLCTNRTCSDGDPVLEAKHDNLKPKKIYTEPKVIDSEVTESDTEQSINHSPAAGSVIRKDMNELEIYAPCNPHKSYTIGRQNCECLANNRLICKEYNDYMKRETKTERGQPLKSEESLCTGKVETTIKLKCNLCKCVRNGFMYCSIKKCMQRDNRLSLVFRTEKNLGKTVNAPADDIDCIPGTSYKRGCNTCYCTMLNGQKIFGCTLKQCEISTLYDVAKDCVSNTTYELNCLICSCDIIDGEKQQACKVNSKCMSSLVLKENRSDSLESLHGYCEPLHVYRIGCNVCRCLSSGDIIKCTTRKCIVRSPEPIEVEIVPLQQAVSEPCPKGHSYKIGCNLCFCLSNGNALCTTANCSQ